MSTQTSPKRPSPVAPGGPLPFRSAVVAVDLSPGSDRVVQRAALVPLAPLARITLVHAVPRSLPARARAAASSDARAALRQHAARLKDTVDPSVKVQWVVRSGSAASQISDVAAEAGAQLLVMGRGGQEKLTELFLGSTAERVLRSARVPVLVVRLAARRPYERPLLAADAEAPLHALLATLFRLVPPPRPKMAWVHAFDTPMRGLIYPSLSVTESAGYEAQFERTARAAVSQRLDAARARVSPSDRAAWHAMVLPGSPRSVIPKSVAMLRADLLAMGTQARSGLSHAMLGTVAGDVLRDVGCDVLVVPPRKRP